MARGRALAGPGSSRDRRVTRVPPRDARAECDVAGDDNELVPEPCQEPHCGHDGSCSRLLDAPEYSAIERDPKWSHNQDREHDKDNGRQQADRQRGSRVGLRSHQATDS